MILDIMTYNIQHGLVYRDRLSKGEGASYSEYTVDPGYATDAIAMSGCEVVGLNETYAKSVRPGFNAQAEAIAKPLGFTPLFSRAITLRDGDYGNSLVTSLRVLSHETFIVPDPPRTEEGYYETRCILKAVLQKGAEEPFTVLVHHFGLMPGEQENSVTLLRELLGTAPKRTILMGDFNVTPDNPLLDPIRELMRDTFVAAEDPAALSWPADVPERRIDYMFVTPDIKPLRVRIPVCQISDHRPYIAQLEM